MQSALPSVGSTLWLVDSTDGGTCEYRGLTVLCHPWTSVSSDFGIHEVGVGVLAPISHDTEGWLYIQLIQLTLLVFYFVLSCFCIHLFLAVLGLCCFRVDFSPVAGGRGCSLVAGSVVAAPRTLEHRLSSCSSLAQLLLGMWDLPRSGIEPVFLALAGGLSSTMPPRKS